MNSFDDLINTVDTLEPLPQTATLLAQIVANEKSKIDEAVQVVQYDPALVADILKMTNSAFYASNRRISCIRDAVIRLGTGRILEIIVSNRVRGIMKQPLVHYGYIEDDLWRHSVASALAAEHLNKYVPVQISGVSYTAALLHDLGKLLIIRYFPEAEIQRIIIYMKENNTSWAEAEKNIFNFTHAEVGAHVASLWKMPEPIVQAILNHNNVTTDYDPITDSVRVANVVARAIGQGLGYEGMGVDIDSEIAERLTLSRENYELLCAETAQKLEEVLVMYESDKG